MALQKDHILRAIEFNEKIHHANHSYYCFYNRNEVFVVKSRR